MKKIYILIIVISFFYPGASYPESPKTADQVKTETFLSSYRFDPFQWIYPEYYYKADIFPVKKDETPIQEYSKIKFYGLSAYVPTRYTSEVKRDHDIMTFTSKSGDRILMIKATNSSFTCSDKKSIERKDFCSAYKTPQQLFHKLYTLTPDSAETIGDKWIIHDKGKEFDNVKKIEIYSDDLFMAYVKFIKDSLIEQTEYSHEISLFHANGPLESYVNIRFKSKDDAILNHFISTIE